LIFPLTNVLSQTQFYKYFEPQTPISDITETAYNHYVMHLRDILDNDVSINSYLRDLLTTLHFLMDEGYISPFPMKAIKVDKTHVETYTEDELKALLQKPNIKKCKFVEYQSWVMTNFLFCTGIRQRSLMNIQVKDIDFDNNYRFADNDKRLA
jgi:integrase/recombinase XerD